MFDKFIEKAIVFLLAILAFAQAWIAIHYMIKAADDESIGGIYKGDDTKDNAIFTTVIIVTTFIIMVYALFMAKKERNDRMM
jgi:hypothetical protein